jgi:hypothetical protein
MAAVDLSALPAKLGTYALSNYKEILTGILQDDLSFLKYFGNVIPTNDELPLAQLTMNTLLQPGGKDAFNAKQAGEFKARIGKVRACKADVSWAPSVIKAMWQSYLGQIDGGKIDPATIPFEAFLIAKVIAKVKQELHYLAVYKGVLNAGGTAPADTMNGLVKLIATAALPAGNIAAAPGTITAANAGDKLKLVLECVDDTYYDLPMVCIVSPKVARFYNAWYQTTYGSLPYNTEYKKTFLEGTMIEIVSEPGLSGTNHIIITPKENLFWLVDDSANMERVIVEKEKRNIHVMMDFNASPEIGMGEIVWTNIQAAV